MPKFIFISFAFHIALMILFKLDIIEIDKNKEKIIKVGILEDKKTTNPKKSIAQKKEKKEKRILAKEKKSKAKTKKKINETKKEIKKIIKKNNKNKQFDDLLKNLADEKLEKDKDNFDKKIIDLSKKQLIDNVITNKGELIAIEKIIIEQIDQNWSRPPGIKISKDLEIKIIIFLDINGQLINVVVHKKTLNEIKNNSSLQPYLDSSLRAVKKASPFEGLRKDRYNIWKEIIINFKPVEAR